MYVFISDRVHILEDRSLRLENVGLDDMGEYTCEADNAVGAVASTGNLVVYGKLLVFLCQKLISGQNVQDFRFCNKN